MEFLLQTIEYKGSSFTPLSLIFCGILVFVAGFFVARRAVKGIKECRKRTELEKQLAESRGRRLRCSDCAYCKMKLDKPFYKSYVLASWQPSYCRKFKMSLPIGKHELRCLAKDPQNAMRMKNNIHNAT